MNECAAGQDNQLSRRAAAGGAPRALLRGAARLVAHLGAGGVFLAVGAPLVAVVVAAVRGGRGHRRRRHHQEGHQGQRHHPHALGHCRVL